MHLSLYPYPLQFKFPFKIAHGLRSYTDVVYVKLEHQGFIAWGEAALPPYQRETQKSVMDFLSAIDLDVFKIPLDPDAIFSRLNGQYAGNMAAKAALDMALWHLKSQMEGKSIGELLGVQATQFPQCTYTLGVCGLAEMKMKLETASEAGFEIFKVKLDGEKDEQTIDNFRKLSGNPFAVDVNQGWKTVEQAERMIQQLNELGCLLIEQPLPVALDLLMPAITEKSEIPIYADESCQSVEELERMCGAFKGVNIKLMKCGGIGAAFKMIKRAKQLNLQILIGCMSESSVSCTAAAHLSPLAGYADLDGPYLIANDPFQGMKMENGRIAMHALQQTKPV